MAGNNDHPLISGLITGVVATFIVLGSLVTSLSEGPMVMAGDIVTPETSYPAPAGEITPVPPVDAPVEPSATPFVQNTPLPSPSAKPPTATTTASAPPAAARSCPPPGGWYVITVQKGDTLAGLAEKFRTTPEILAKANCIASGTEISSETIIYVPGPAAPATEACSQPTGWVKYSIRSGDTLGSISQRANTTIQKIQEGNCLGNSTNIQVGQVIYIPSLPATATLYPWSSATPALWFSPTPALYYPSPTYAAYGTLVPTVAYPTYVPVASETPLVQSPLPSMTVPPETSPWPLSTNAVDITPWPSATSNPD